MSEGACRSKGVSALGAGVLSLSRQKIDQQFAQRGGLLLLNPVSRAFDQVHAAKLAAGGGFHRLQRARTLIGAPIAFSGDETARHVHDAAGVCLQLRGTLHIGRIAIPLKAAAKRGSREFVAVHPEFIVGQPSTLDRKSTRLNSSHRR